jgi:hypothetical protein
VVRPGSVAEVEALVCGPPGEPRPPGERGLIGEPDVIGERGVIGRGLGRSYGAAAQNGGGLVLDMTSLARIRSFDGLAGSVTVDAGVDLDRLLRSIVPLGWFVGVTPGTRFVTVGGAIAADIHGKNHHRDGGFCDHVESFELVTPAEGPMLVGRGTDIFRATAGGMGLTGLVVGATLRLLRVETSWIRVDTERATDLDDLMARMDEGDHRYRYSVAWIDCMAGGGRLGRGVLTRGDHAVVAELPERARRDPLRYGPRQRLVAPPVVPSGLINRATVAAFNEAWFRKAPRMEVGRPQRLEAFFHPLDGVGGWTRLYGPRGFLHSWPCSSGSVRGAGCCRSRWKDGRSRSTCRRPRRGSDGCSTGSTSSWWGPAAVCTWRRTPACAPSCSPRCIRSSTGGGRYGIGWTRTGGCGRTSTDGSG